MAFKTSLTFILIQVIIMHKIALIGVGRVGRLALDLLVNDIRGIEVMAVDCRDLSKYIGKYDNVKFVCACKPKEVIRSVIGSDLLALALPSGVVYDILYEALKSSFNIVDISYIDFDPYILSEIIHEESFYIPNAGFSPGLTNLIAGYVYNKLGELDKLVIYVGGIPTEPIPPVSYQITWNPEDLIEMYTRSVKMVVDGKLKEVDPLDNIFNVEIPGIGSFEGFYSEGLATLTRNIKARNLYEVTLRHPGHLNSMKLLRQLGLFDKEPVEVDGYLIQPYKLTAKIFEKYLKQTIPDQAILYIEAYKGDYYYKFKSHLVGGEDYSATALYTALVFARTVELALNEYIKPGIYPLETLSHLYQEYISYLRSKGVYIEINSNF